MTVQIKSIAIGMRQVYRHNPRTRPTIEKLNPYRATHMSDPAKASRDYMLTHVPPAFDDVYDDILNFEHAPGYYVNMT